MSAPDVVWVKIENDEIVALSDVEKPGYLKFVCTEAYDPAITRERLNQAADALHTYWPWPDVEAELRRLANGGT